MGLHAQEPLTGLLEFLLLLTGYRSLEARTLEARYPHGELAVFPADESKGEMQPRVLYSGRKPRLSWCPWRSSASLGHYSELTRQTVDVGRHPGPSGTISKKVRAIAYGARYSFATNALLDAKAVVGWSERLGELVERLGRRGLLGQASCPE